jgi:hypothetical protein
LSKPASCPLGPREPVGRLGDVQGRIWLARQARSARRPAWQRHRPSAAAPCALPICTGAELILDGGAFYGQGSQDFPYRSAGFPGCLDHTRGTLLHFRSVCIRLDHLHPTSPSRRLIPRCELRRSYVPLAHGAALISSASACMARSRERASQARVPVCRCKAAYARRSTMEALLIP